MNEQIKAILMKKQEKRERKLVMQDVNVDLIVALMAIPVYGKEARDEEILSIIINSGSLTFQSMIDKIKEEFNKNVKEKKLKKSKDGFLRDKDGFIHLKPRM